MNLIKKLICWKVIFPLLIILIVVYYFFNESYSFLDNFWIFIFLLCPLMHMFMHKGHHKKDDKGENDES